jgi:CHAT domain-containing protein/tetratricopeptide (TPR) repeat protein
MRLLHLFASISVALCCLGQSGLCHAQGWRALCAQADSLSKTHQADSAIVIAQMALDSARASCGAADTSLASALTTLANCFYRNNSFDQAESPYREAHAIRKGALGSNNALVANSMNELGNTYSQLGRFAEAESLYQSTLSIREEVFGLVHAEVAAVCNNLGLLYRMIGKYDECEAILQRSLGIDTALFGWQHADVAMVLDNLGGLYLDLGRYAEAENQMQRALEILENQTPPNHKVLVRELNNLGTVYSVEGRNSEAEMLYKRSLDIIERQLGKWEPELAYGLYGLATLYMVEGKPTEAEPMIRRAQEIWERANGHDFPDVANCLSALGIISVWQARFADAETYSKEALEIRITVLGKEHPDVAYSHVELGNIYLELNRTDKAEALIKTSLEIRRAALGDEHPDVANSYHTLGQLYAKKRYYPEAEAAFQNAVSIFEKVFGSDHQLVASSLAQFGRLYFDWRRFPEADSLLRRALSIQENAYGPNHPEVAETVTYLADLLMDSGRWDEARILYERAYDIRRKNFRDGSEALSEHNVLTYSVFARDAASKYVSVMMNCPAGTLRDDAELSRTIFSSKGQVTDGIFARRRTLQQKTDVFSPLLADSLRAARTHLANLYVKGSDQDHPEVYHAAVEFANTEKNRLEAELARESADFRRELELWDVSPRTLQAELPDNTALIEYCRYDRSLEGHDAIPQYLAVVLPKRGVPAIIDLGSAGAIDSMVNWYRSLLQARSTVRANDYQDIAQRLYATIWKPLEPYIDGEMTVFIAADGALSFLSFAGLMDDRRSYLIERHPLHYLSTGRDLLRLKENSPSGSGLLAMGDPDFDASAEKRAEAESETIALDPLHSSNRLRNVLSDCRALRERKVSQLPGTRFEVERIAQVWKQVNSQPIVLLEGAQASEEGFERESVGKRVIHLATHGYSLSGECGADNFHRSADNTKIFVSANPLLLSGLFLAGANQHEESGSGSESEDGIVTAEEVAGMNLSGTRLVVMSGCETGLGEIKPGEGVFGLRRAFHIAGARTVISALWPVSDTETVDMMTRLYERADDNIPLLMQTLATEKIRELRASGKPDIPTDWGAFIAEGDWRGR